ncbi:hypothetical protein BEP19_16335 [Ammoniphilus oxalaticus]|uniref:3-hydroxyisobutyryl-CoA hydrolase n=1 Tax=Ammoniphilus oxalaticus TaxID=66863 RepID=A0A419SQU1_9BACL|nr:enoyl-CoA hydratase/isomerase family protein [Ammoniphilus oxalaticus]RKD26767.1 hypothetical protein BEP19_16335 [Ammoniphilus oxalaticus]
MNQDLHVIFTVENSVGWITLNRPKALNALSYEMVLEIREQLRIWKDNPAVALVCIVGAGDRALCAGADIRALYQEKHTSGDARALARAYFSAQYEMDHIIHTYPKPCLVIMDGIVMGGGVGLSIGCSHRLVTENTKWAMPEMNIGFFPDVGASYFLNQMPGHVGRYLALTSETITAADTLYIGAADLYLAAESVKPCLEALRAHPWQQDGVQEDLATLLHSLSSPSPEPSLLEEHQDKINEHFRHNCVEEIVSSLKEASLVGCDWSAQKIGAIQQKSPTSLKVTLEQMMRGKTLPLDACFNMEVELGVEFMGRDDFFEGVRATLIDKDKAPQWSPQHLKDVTSEMVAAYFQEMGHTSSSSSIS